MNHPFKTIFAAGAALGITLCAGAGQDLPLNGDFRGAPGPGHIVPGWIVSTPGGVRLFPRHRGKQILELMASPRHAKIAVSDLHRAGAGVLEIKADVSGRGNASLGFEAFDASRRTLLQSDKQSWVMTDIDGRIKFNFRLTDPRIAFVRITLTAEPGSIARFHDVEAEIKYPVAPVAPVAPVPPPPPPPLPPPPVAQVLINDAFYTLESLPRVSVFQVNLPPGRDIDFKLGEHPSRRQYWSVAGGYDPRICRIEAEHKHKRGVSYFDVELKAMFRGTTKIEFVNPAGKRVIVRFTSL